MKKFRIGWAFCLFMAVTTIVTSCSKSEEEEQEQQKPAYSDVQIDNAITGKGFMCEEMLSIWFFSANELGDREIAFYGNERIYLKYFGLQEGNIMRQHGYYVRGGIIHLMTMTGFEKGYDGYTDKMFNTYSEFCTVIPTEIANENITATAIFHNVKTMSFDYSEKPKTIHLTLSR